MKSVQSARDSNKPQSCIECVVPENIHTPPTEGMGNSGEEGGFQRPKHLKECMKLNCNFRRGGGVIGQIPSVEGMDIFWNQTIQILHTEFYIFVVTLLGRMCLTIKTCLLVNISFDCYDQCLTLH